MAKPTNDSSSQLIAKVTAYVQQYMSQYDGSHDYTHIQRVLGLAQQIASASASASASAPAPAPAPASPSPERPAYDPLVLTLSALLHDVGDKKYLAPGEDARTLVRDVLLGLGAPAGLAETVQAVVSAVSYSAEMRDPDRVRRMVAAHPELAVVQDADRLDALGAVGVGRAFTYGGAAGARSGEGGRGGGGMAETIDHFTQKLERLEGMMKTEAGREMARERTRRLRVFRGWWEEEQGWAGVL